MRILITGGGGFIGQKIARALLARGGIADEPGAPPQLTELVLFDQAFPPNRVEDARVRYVTGDMLDRRPARTRVRAASRRGLSFCVRGERGRGGRFRPRHARERRRHAQPAGDLPCAARTAAPCFPELGGGVRRRFAGSRAGYDRADAAIVLRHAESHRRAHGERLHAQGIHRRARRAAADDRRAARASRIVRPRAS